MVRGSIDASGTIPIIWSLIETGSIGGSRDIGDIWNTKAQFDRWFFFEGGKGVEGVQSTGFLRCTHISILPEQNIEIPGGENAVERLADGAEG